MDEINENMKKVAIIAPTGMLGSMVYNVLKEKYVLVLIHRDSTKLKILDEAYGGVEKHRTVQCDLMDLYTDYVTGFPKTHNGPNTQKLFDAIGDVDAVINCAGLTKPHSLKDPTRTFFINGALPHILSWHYENKLIHITSDCAYNGIDGAPYDERSPFTSNDFYGLSKVLGEPKDRSLVLRTSIVGPEISEFVLFISWLKQQEGKVARGFTNHWWNGITTRAFANICTTIISDRDLYPSSGLYHIFSTDVTKYEMVMAFKKKYGIDVTVESVVADPAVDRRLRTVYDFCKKLNIPPFQEMVDAL